MHADDTWSRIDDLPLRNWRPRAKAKPVLTPIAAAAVPAIDIHTHLGRQLGPDWEVGPVDALISRMDELNLETLVNLDGGWGDEVDANLDRYDRSHPGRFVTFCNVDWSVLTGGGSTADLVSALNDSARRGARGVKVYKTLGLSYRDANGDLLMPDDERVLPVLQRAGELGLPVLIHTGDPMAFFDPLDEHNERLDELRDHRDWWFGDRVRFPTFDQLANRFEHVVGSCPGTMFIAAHVANLAEDLTAIDDLLVAHHNLHVDISARLGEIGRQPRGFAKLVATHPDRILFGTDENPLESGQFVPYFRFLETEDEAFDYDTAHDIPPTGRWQISGAGLAGETLEAVYAGNARRLLGM